jgi:hypothetical protein
MTRRKIDDGGKETGSRTPNQSSHLNISPSLLESGPTCVADAASTSSNYEMTLHPSHIIIRVAQPPLPLLKVDHHNEQFAASPF